MIPSLPLPPILSPIPVPHQGRPCALRYQTRKAYLPCPFTQLQYATHSHTGHGKKAETLPFTQRSERRPDLDLLFRAGSPSASLGFFFLWGRTTVGRSRVCFRPRFPFRKSKIHSSSIQVYCRPFFVSFQLVPVSRTTSFFPFATYFLLLLFPFRLALSAWLPPQD